MNPTKHSRSIQTLMVSPVNFLRAYSGFQHLHNSLTESNHRAKILAAIPKSMMGETTGFHGELKSYRSSFLGRLPRLWKLEYHRLLKKLLGERPDCVVLNCTSPTSLTHPLVEYRRQNPDTRLVLYCSELWLPGEPVKIPDATIHYFKRNIGVADLIIDVEPKRAELRKEHFKIDHELAIIPNTLPKHGIPAPASPGKLRELLGPKVPQGHRLLLYTGSSNSATVDDFKVVLHSLKQANAKVTIVWYCHGDEECASKVEQEIESKVGKGYCRVMASIPRKQLLALVPQADAGLIAYPCHTIQTANQRYAAPSKMYEFLAAGLPIASYGNPSIKSILDAFDLGICAEAETPESLSAAIQTLFGTPQFDQKSQRCATTFSTKLCYEVSASAALERIQNLFSEVQ